MSENKAIGVQTIRNTMHKYQACSHCRPTEKKKYGKNVHDDEDELLRRYMRVWRLRCCSNWMRHYAFEEFFQHKFVFYMLCGGDSKTWIQLVDGQSMWTQLNRRISAAPNMNCSAVALQLSPTQTINVCKDNQFEGSEYTWINCHNIWNIRTSEWFVHLGWWYAVRILFRENRCFLCQVQLFVDW